MAAGGLIGWGLALAWAAGAWGQSPKPLEYSRKMMVYDGPQYYNPDTILIRNPNAVDLRCDSIEMLLGKTQLYGLHVFEHREAGSGTLEYMNLYPSRFGRPDSAGPVVFPYADAKLDFPKGKQILFIWRLYDPCPVCKRSAEAVSSDTLRFRMVLHVRGMQDTLSMSIHRRFTVGLGRPKILKSTREEPESRPVRDLLGRRWAPWRSSGFAVRPISP